MRKLTIFSAIMTLFIVIGIVLIYSLKFIIIDILIDNDKLRLASALYGEDAVLEKISKNGYISVVSKSSSYNIYVDKIEKEEKIKNSYEEEILTKDKGNKNYKLIDLKINGYKSYLVAIYDPSKIKLVSSKGFNQHNTGQQTVKEICERYKGMVCVNGGGFVDYGTGSDIPYGVVIEDGKITWEEDGVFSIVGFNKSNELVLLKSTGKEALENGVRDALVFEPFLISDGEILIDKNESVGGFLGAARVAIAQRKDGIVLFLVTEGMHSKGPTVYQVAEILKKYGAWTAANLDGGASSSLVINNKLINNPINIYGQPVNYGNGRRVVTGFGFVK